MWEKDYCFHCKLVTRNLILFFFKIYICTSILMFLQIKEYLSLLSYKQSLDPSTKLVLVYFRKSAGKGNIHSSLTKA